MTCQRCSTPHNDGDRFCGNCGAPLGDESHHQASTVQSRAKRNLLALGVVLAVIAVVAVTVRAGADADSDASPTVTATPIQTGSTGAPRTTVISSATTPLRATTTLPPGAFPDVFAADVVDGLDLVVWLDSGMFVLDLDDLSEEVIGPGTAFVSEVSVFETVGNRIVVIDDSLTNAVLPGDKGSFVLLGRANRIFSSERSEIAWTVEFGEEQKATAHRLTDGASLGEVAIPAGARVRGAYDDGLVVSAPSGMLLLRPDSTEEFAADDVLVIADPWMVVSRCSADLVCEIVVRNGLTGDEWIALSSEAGDDVAVAGRIEVAPTGDGVIVLRSAQSEVFLRDGARFQLPAVGTHRPKWSRDAAWITNRDSERIIFSAADGTGNYEFRFVTHGYGEDMPFNLNEAYTLICNVEDIDGCVP
jgi:hypothetical protein